MGQQTRATFGSRLSAVLVAAGGAVGLGNIWRFPYVAGENGGGAFLAIYILCAVVIGLPIMLGEFAIGRSSHSNAFGAFRHHSNLWKYMGFNCILTSFLIMGFYCVVAGWTIEYTVHSVASDIAGSTLADDHAAYFSAFISNPWRPVLYTVVAMLITHTIIALGVRKGIERCSRMLMPVLLVMLVVLAVRSLLMPGGHEGLRFLLYPDFSKVTARTLLVAIGQVFFSLSVGLGSMITYASYFKADTDLRATAVNVTVIDTLVAILAGLVIFPAVFSVGIEPSAGSSLVFITLPSIFATMPLSNVWSTIFFLLLAVAALTSVMSLHEVITAYIHEEWHVRRRAAAWVTTLSITALGTMASLSLGMLGGWRICGLTVFDALDFVTANIMLPVSGMFSALFAGWVIRRTTFRAELTGSGSKGHRQADIVRFLLRYVCPIMLSLIFLDNLGLLNWI